MVNYGSQPLGQVPLVSNPYEPFQEVQGPQGYAAPIPTYGGAGGGGAGGFSGGGGGKGAKGVQGNQGGTGPFGGPQGPQGNQGNQGFQGTNPGPSGPQGNQGIAGPTGGSGVQGPQGRQGFQGSGVQGPQGIQGIPGSGTIQRTEVVDGAATPAYVTLFDYTSTDGMFGIGALINDSAPLAGLDARITAVDFFGVTEIRTFSVPSVDPAGLVGYWKLDEAAGVTAFDSSGNANDGTYINGPTPSTDVPPQINFSDPFCRDFDAAFTQYVDVPDDGTLQNIFTAGGTLSLWVNTALGDAFISKGVWMFRLRIDFGFPHLRFQHNATVTDGEWKTLPGSFPTSGWHHVAVVFNKDAIGNLPLIYIDGTLQTLEATPAAAGAFLSDVGSPVHLATNVPGIQDYTGLLDDVRMYNAPLSTGDVMSLADGNEGITGGSVLVLDTDINVGPSYPPFQEYKLEVRRTDAGTPATYDLEFSVFGAL